MASCCGVGRRSGHRTLMVGSVLSALGDARLRAAVGMRRQGVGTPLGGGQGAANLLRVRRNGKHQDVGLLVRGLRMSVTLRSSLRGSEAWVGHRRLRHRRAHGVRLAFFGTEQPNRSRGREGRPHCRGREREKGREEEEEERRRSQAQQQQAAAPAKPLTSGPNSQRPHCCRSRARLHTGSRTCAASSWRRT